MPLSNQDRYLLETLGPFGDEIALGPEALDCIRRSLDRWHKQSSKEGRPATVDEIADIINPCLCPPFSVTQAVMAYMEAVEDYKWMPPWRRRRVKGGEN